MKNYIKLNRVDIDKLRVRECTADKDIVYEDLEVRNDSLLRLNVQGTKYGTVREGDYVNLSKKISNEVKS